MAFNQRYQNFQRWSETLEAIPRYYRPHQLVSQTHDKCSRSQLASSYLGQARTAL